VHIRAERFFSLFFFLPLLVALGKRSRKSIAPLFFFSQGEDATLPSPFSFPFPSHWRWFARRKSFFSFPPLSFFPSSSNSRAVKRGRSVSLFFFPPILPQDEVPSSGTRSIGGTAMAPSPPSFFPPPSSHLTKTATIVGVPKETFFLPPIFFSPPFFFLYRRFRGEISGS